MDGHKTRQFNRNTPAAEPHPVEQTGRWLKETQMSEPAGWLEKARRFDRETLAEIYDEIQPGLYRYAWRLLGDPGMAEDCVAETFRRFLNALRQGGGPQTALKAYLYRTAHNWITDFYRRTNIQEVPLDDLLLPDQAPGPAQEVASRQEMAEMHRAFRLLTEEQRQVVVLRYIEEWSVEETAAALQKNPNAVRALQHRALASLRRVLEKNEEAQNEA